MRYSINVKKLFKAVCIFSAIVFGAAALAVEPPNSAPRRIVTLAPSLGELAAELVGNDLGRIVGVSEYTDYPPALLKVPSVGPYVRVNLEKVLALKPDLVIATEDGNSKDQILHLREMKIPVLVVSTESLAQVKESIHQIASALKAEAAGEQMVRQLDQGLERIKARAKSRPPTRVLMQIGGEPLVVVGNRSFLNEALELVGAKNIYNDSKEHYPRPSVEDVVRRSPEMILVFALGHDLAPFYRMGKAWDRFPDLAAVKQKKVRLLKGDEILRPTLRLLEGFSLLEKAIYGVH